MTKRKLKTGKAKIGQHSLGQDMPAGFAGLPITKPGMIWQLGEHRVMCGDSVSSADVDALMKGRTADLVHADPPYGMGKTSRGVANDNLYEEKLDAFQMQWWRTFRPHVADKGSAYIWGNSQDLWRLWYRGGLKDYEYLELRNHIIWDKKFIAGMKSPQMTKYPVASEHCLFIQIGRQHIGNVNVNMKFFPGEWEPLRSYLADEAKAVGLTGKKLHDWLGVWMYSHWFTKSQFSLISEKYYIKLQDRYPGYFQRPWSQLKAEWDSVKGPHRKATQQKIKGMRAWFDNTHAAMRDVWEFPRVTGKNRYGHATPKPVAMMERIMRSSLPEGGLCAEPFGGTGSTLMGAENTGRVCYTMELHADYVDVIVRRWQDETGGQAVLEQTGQTFDELETGTPLRRKPKKSKKSKKLKKKPAKTRTPALS